MIPMAFISRHEPTPKQYELAEEKGFHLVHVGDMDAFNIMPWTLEAITSKYEAFAVVNAALAIKLVPYAEYIGVFENGMRPDMDGKSTFFVKALHIYDIPLLCSTARKPSFY